MADVAPIEISKSKKSPKPKEKKVPRKSNTKVNHPSTAVMVNSAIETLKERGGSSLHAIKKYIAATYKIDAEKLSPFIKKYLKNSVVSGGLVQTKGIGASGSFKMATTANSKSSTKKSTVAKSKDAKPATTKKAVVTKKVAKPKKVVKKSAAKKASKPKSPTKAKTTNKVPTKKPKSPKPKVIKPAKKVSPRKK